MLLQKGTRIVLRTAVPAATDVFPPGTVAEIVGVPVDPKHAYRVRFLNGHEAAMQRNEFALLSEVKSEDLSRLPSEMSERGLRDHVIYQCVIGSRAYGLETADSDTDRRGIYQAPTDLVLSLYDPLFALSSALGSILAGRMKQLAPNMGVCEATRLDWGSDPHDDHADSALDSGGGCTRRVTLHGSSQPGG